MKILWIAFSAFVLSQSSTMAESPVQIAIIESSTPAEPLMAKPGTYLGETFVFEEKHTGEVQVQVGVWEAGQGKLNLDNFPFTEYVLMVSGVVIVTEENGVSMRFKAGDTFVIPKGWTGVWDVQERMKKQIVRIGNTGQ